MLNKRRIKELLETPPVPAGTYRVCRVSSYDLAAGYSSTLLLGAIPCVLLGGVERSEMLTTLLIVAAVPALSIALMPTVARKVGPDTYALPPLGDLLAVMVVLALSVVALGAAMSALLDTQTDWLDYGIAFALTVIAATPVSFRQSQLVHVLRNGG
jgi:hypothetical protein